MFFDGWNPLARIVLVGGAAYVAVLVILRLSGKRSLAKLNAFDLVVTVALGSALATTLLSADVALIEGVAAFAVLSAAQFMVAWISVRSKRVRRLVKSDPTVLVLAGRILDHRLREQRVSRGEVLQAVRASGAGDLTLVEAVVLETDGTLSVISADRAGDGGALVDVERPDVRGAELLMDDGVGVDDASRDDVSR